MNRGTALVRGAAGLDCFLSVYLLGQLLRGRWYGGRPGQASRPGLPRYMGVASAFGPVFVL